MLANLPILILTFLFGGDAQICTGTTFASVGDKHAGGASPYLKRQIVPSDLGIAHREYPLGSKVELTHLTTGRSTVVRVIDRGPFGMVDSHGKWRNGVERFRRARRAGKPIPRDGWRACVDMTPATAKKIGAGGFDPVLVRRVHDEGSTHKRLPRRQPQKVRRVSSR